MKTGVMSSRWQCRLFPTSVPLTRRAASNLPWTRYHCENPRTWGWGWSTPRNSETEKDHIRRVRGATTLWPHHSSTRPTQGTPGGLNHLPPLYSPGRLPGYVCPSSSGLLLLALWGNSAQPHLLVCISLC